MRETLGCDPRAGGRATAQRVATAWTLLRLWAGMLLKELGVAGVVQAGRYQAGIGDVSVRVTLGPLFTVVSVNGVDVYLNRFTGVIDGVGFGVASGVPDGGGALAAGYAGVASDC